MIKKILFPFALLVWSWNLFGAEVRVYLVDDKDKDVVRHVTVFLFQGKKKIDEGTSTEKGLLWFSDVKAGNYTLQAGGWGYAEKKVNIVVNDSIESITISLTCSTKKIVTPFSQYNFDEGGYRLVAYRDQSDRNTLADSLGEFYIDDVEVLKELAQKWTFKKPCPRFACGYHYTVSITRNGKMLEDFYINLNCYEIVVGNEPFIFTQDLMRMFYGKGKKFKHASLTFTSLETGRKGVDSLKALENILELSNPTWMLFDGTFAFDYKFKKKPSDDDALYAEISKAIQEKHPGEVFALASQGGSSEIEFVVIQCNKSLFNSFTLAPITKTWKEHIPTIHYFIKR